MKWLQTHLLLSCQLSAWAMTCPGVHSVPLPSMAGSEFGSCCWKQPRSDLYSPSLVNTPHRECGHEVLPRILQMKRNLQADSAAAVCFTMWDRLNQQRGQKNKNACNKKIKKLIQELKKNVQRKFRRKRKEIHLHRDNCIVSWWARLMEELLYLRSKRHLDFFPLFYWRMPWGLLEIRQRWFLQYISCCSLALLTSISA